MKTIGLTNPKPSAKTPKKEIKPLIVDTPPVKEDANDKSEH